MDEVNGVLMLDEVAAFLRTDPVHVQQRAPAGSRRRCNTSLAPAPSPSSASRQETTKDASLCAGAPPAGGDGERRYPLGVATNRRIVRSNTKRPAGYWTIRAPELVPIGFYCGGDALLAPAHSLVVGDVVQLELDLSLDLVFDLDLDLGRVVGIQGGRVEIAGEDRCFREARHDDPMDVARPGGALHVELTRCRAS